MLEHPIATFFLSFLVSQLGPNLAAEFVYDIGRKRANSLFDRTHFTNQILADALARSFDRAVSSISLGLTWRYFRLEFVEEKVVGEFANRLERLYLYPFYMEYNAKFDEDLKREFRRNGKKNCGILNRDRDTILQMENIVNSSVQKLLLPLQIEQNSDTTAIENLALQARISIIDAIRSVDEIDELFCDFLEFNNLLLDAMSYFFLDIVTSEQKVQWTLQHFSVQELRKEVSKLSGQLDDDISPQTGKLIEILEQVSPISNDIDLAFGSLKALTESSFALVLSEIGEVRQGVDEIGAQIAGMERRLMDAIKRRDHAEVAEASAELAYLKDRQQKTESAEKSANAGLDAYRKGMIALESGNREQSLIHYSEAEDHFRKAVEVIPQSDRRKADYLTSLGNSMTMQGKVEDAIPTYERAINLSPDYAYASKELIKRLLEFGDKQHYSRQFEAAIATFKYALLLDGENEQTRGKLALSLNEHANALWAASSSERHTRDRCRMMMLEAVFHSPMVEQYHKNLRVMQGVPSPRPGIVFGLEDFQGSARVADATDAQYPQPFFDVLLNTSFPDSLKYWIELFLPEFRELLSNAEVQRPIHFWWYEDGNQAMKEQMEAIGISSVEVAVSQIKGREHYIVFNASQHSNDVKLAIGNLAHELSHEAFKALGASAQLPDWPTTKVTHVANEHIADLLAIYKGFGLFLLRSRKQIEGDGFEGDYAALTPIEIERFMRRDEESAAKIKLNYAASLKRQGQSEEANATFVLLKHQWQRILRHDAQYDFGWYQVAVLCDWLDDKNEAVRAVQKAINLSGNKKYRRYLTNLRLTDEEKARRMVKEGSVLINTGRLKSANRLFTQAESIWREQLNTYSDIARVHFELAIVLEWQKRIPEAVNEYRLALALDPSNDAYRSKLQNVLHAYEQ